MKIIDTHDYNEFMEWYENEHSLCPKCGSSEYMSTLASFILDFNNLGNFKDLNICTCTECENKHTRHDRVRTINDIV